MTPSAESESCDVLIIGAGIAGLTAARELRNAGKRVIVLEKSRGLGGRAATRRWDGMPVDHGAQFFTARSPEFRAQVDEWLQRGVCFEWSRGLHRASEIGPLSPTGDNFPRYACREGIASLGRDLAGSDSSFVLRESKAASIRRHPSAWEVGTEDGRVFSAPSLVMTPPPPQSADLLAAAAPQAASIVSSLAMAPCLALVARYPRKDYPWRGIQAPDHAVISWIGHDTSKRTDLHPDTTILVIHASATFSRDNFGTSEDMISAQLLESASDMVGEDLTHPADHFLQRWRYALGPDTSAHHAETIPGAPSLVLAGDAIAGGKVEGAWLSGREAARLVSTD